MRARAKAKGILGIIEILCWVIGITLVAVYIGLKIDGEVERRQAVAEFEAAASRLPPAATASAHEQIVQAPVPLTYPAPDKTYWSKGRIRAYQAAASARGKAGLPVAVLQISSLGLEVPVYSTASAWNLNRGAALVAGTAAPDSRGNTAIAAHRDGYFRALEHIALGDILDVRTLHGSRRYKVIWLKIVKPSDVSVLRQTAVPAVTLVTCYPFHFVGSAPSRFIVRAVAVD